MSGVSVVNTSQLLQHKHTYTADLFFENFFANPLICYGNKKCPPTRPALSLRLLQEPASTWLWWVSVYREQDF